ncbi:MAG: T9SS type A sorting domain-containing protein [Ignavibacteriae bacterium]|nr:T9SS type A sorting domain-containing protein [Ignavibacteriota bacterium]
MSLLNLKYCFIILFFFVVLTINNSFSQSGWIHQNSDITTSLNSVKFVNSLTGICAGNSGIILRTTNGGINWVPQSSGFSGNFNSVYFSSENIGYVVGDSANSGFLFKTTTGGINWNRCDLTTNVLLISVFFINDKIGFTSGESFSTSGYVKIYKTIDGGVTWDSIDSNTSFLFNIYFINSSTGWHTGGYVVLGSQSLYKTTNGGINWFIQFDGQAPVREVFFIDSLNGWFSGRSSFSVATIFKTTNGGSNWTPNFPGTGSIVNSLYFINKNKGWAATENRIIQATTNGGINWINQTYFQSGINYNSVYFADSLNGWTVGDSGTILKTTTGGVLTGFSNTSVEIPDNYSLSQNYPNPFNPSTIINYTIPNQGNVELKLFDIVGKEVATLVSESKPAGSYEVEFSANSEGKKFPSGIYFYSLSVDGNIIDTKRMVLLK